MAKEIFNTQGMAESIRYTEYKNIYSAISEIVDNSIEANAKEIVIVLKVYQYEGKEKIDDIAVLDNGIGMNEQILQDCLVFGSSTKQERTSMGRFGVGLGQASLFAAPRVEVYSWQNRGNPQYVFLDTDLMKKGKQTEIPTPIEKFLPNEFSTYKNLNILVSDKKSEISFSENGTMIVWRGVDKIPGKVSTFKTKLSDELGRKFRYYLKEGVRIFITDTAYSFIESVQLIDPMFLMSESKILGNTSDTTRVATNLIGEPIFEPFDSIETPNGEFKTRVVLNNKHQKPIFGDIYIRASIVKEKFYYGGSFKKNIHHLPGKTDVGNMLKKYENISILRAAREIQFDKAGLYDSVNSPTNRWWSIEIEFTPSLDEFFKLSNNKQKVEFVTSYYQAFIDEKNGSKKKIKNISIDDIDSIEEKYWIEIVGKIKNLISLMVKRNKSIQSKYSNSNDQTTGVQEQSKTIDIEIPSKTYQQLQQDKIGNKKSVLENIVEKEIREYETKKYSDSFLVELVPDVSITDLFFLVRENNGKITSRVNYNHDFFKLKELVVNGALDETILKVFIHAFNELKLTMNTFEKRKIFDDFTSRFNEELNSIHDKLLRGEKNDES